MIAKASIGALAAALAFAAPAMAQVGDINSTSGSDAAANSGSVSGAASDQNQGQAQQANNYGMGNSRSDSASSANSGSVSESGSSSDQGQSQGQSLSNQLGQSASNSQGVSVSNTFLSTNRKVSELRTNAPVPLAASSSFSTDYCGGTASGGASIAPIGVSIGGAAPTFDRTCQYIRLSQTGGMMAANWHNLGQPEMSNRVQAFATWAMCMAGPDRDAQHRRNREGQENVTMQACIALGLLGSAASPTPPPPAPEPAIVQPNGQPTPEAVERYKTPRGDLQFESVPVIQAPPIAAMVALPR